MNKRKISAKELVSDIKSGMTDAQLMAKHELTPKALEGLFSKLIQAGVLNAASIRERGVVKKGPTPGVFEGQADPKPAVSDEQRPTELLKTIADEVKSGVHDSEIMRRHELSPGKLKQIKNELVQLGYLAAEQAQPAETKRTKLCPFCSQEIQQHASKCVHCGQWLNAREAGGGVGAYQPAAGISRPQFDEAHDDEDERECPWDDRANYGTLKRIFCNRDKMFASSDEILFKPAKRRGLSQSYSFRSHDDCPERSFRFYLEQLAQQGRWAIRFFDRHTLYCPGLIHNDPHRFVCGERYLAPLSSAGKRGE